MATDCEIGSESIKSAAILHSTTKGSARNEAVRFVIFEGDTEMGLYSG
jgi:hypothetical protein